MLKWLRLVVDVKRHLIIFRAKLFSEGVMLVVSVFVASILIETNVLPEVVALEDPMVRNHPIIGW